MKRLATLLMLLSLSGVMPGCLGGFESGVTPDATLGGGSGGAGGGSGGAGGGGGGEPGAAGSAHGGTGGDHWDAALAPDQGSAALDATPPPDAGGDSTRPVAGTYLVVLSTFIRPDRPFLAEATVAVGAGDPMMTLRFLRCMGGGEAMRDCPRTYVDVPPVGPFPIQRAPDDSFVVRPGTLTVPGAANPITGRELVMDAEWQGHVLDSGGFCGGISGQVTSPIMAPLTPDSSRFAGVPLSAGQTAANYPEPLPLGCP